MSNLVSGVKTEFNRGIAQEINQGLTFIPSIEPVQESRAISTDVGRLADMQDINDTQMQVVRHANNYLPDISAGTMAPLSEYMIEPSVEMMAIELPDVDISMQQLQTAPSPWTLMPNFYKETAMELDDTGLLLDEFQPEIDYFLQP